MRTLKTLVLLTFSISQAHAAIAPDCSDLTFIDQIKAYVTCQGSLQLAACGALGGAVAGRVVSKSLQARYLKQMDAAQDTMARDIAEAARDEAREARRIKDPKARLAQIDAEFARQRAAGDLAGERYRQKRALETAVKQNPNGPWYEPLIKRTPGEDLTAYDVANLKYDELPEWYRRSFDVRARSTADLIRTRVASGQPLDEAFIKSASKEVYERWAKDFRQQPRASGDFGITDEFFTEESEHVKAMVKAGIKRVNAIEASVLSNSVGGALKAARALGSASPLVAAGLVAVPFFVAGQIADAKATACAQAESPFVNQDSANNCAPKFEVDDRVASFVDKSPAEKRAIMARAPGVCAYYKKMHQAFFAQPKFEGLTCEGAGPARGRVIVKARDESGQPREFRADVREDKTVSAIGVYGGGGMKVRLYNFANVNEDLTTKLSAESGAGRELRQVKLFMPEAVACCREGGAECAQSFGAKSSGPAETAKVAPAISQ